MSSTKQLPIADTVAPRRRSRVMSRSATATIVSLAILSACTLPGPNGRTTPPPTAQSGVTPIPTIEPLGAADCRPASPSGAFPAEVYGTAKGGTVWAWFMAAYPPQAGIEDKTVWRLDGANAFGSPTFTLIGPAGQPGRLNWGPEEHLGSSWNRPGHEFGTGLLFPTGGCWDVHVTVGQLTGDVYIAVS
jgi:hypothetical protein